MKHILVIGSINMDLSIRTSHLPQPGETITGFGFEAGPGGKGANQAVAAARLGGDVAMIGGVGRDVYAQPLLDNLRQSGVKTHGVETFGGSSGIAVITICQADNQIILDRGANEKLSPEVIDRHRDLLEWADLVLFQLEIPMNTLLYAARLAKECGAKVLLNPAPMCDLPEELLKSTDIFVPNEHEAARLLGTPLATLDKAKKAAVALRQKGMDRVIITLGSQGCVAADKDHLFHASVDPCTPVDTTAAVDGFIGALAVGLCEEMSLRQAVRFATAASSITVSRPGASHSLPTREEVEPLLARPLFME